jgi:hypothetical protein
MVGTALAAPTLNMYLLTEDDCRVCHDDTGVLKTKHHDILSVTKQCSTCHNPGTKKLDCMKSDCHAEDGVGVTNHHDFDEMNIIFDDDLVNDCFYCHEQGVPRGG